MSECEHLIGRPRDLCEGRGLDGRPNPTQEACDQRRLSMGLPLIVVENPAEPTTKQAPVVSSIGTNLAKLFHDRVGAIPCGRCKREIRNLNSMTAEDVIADRENIIDRIEKASRKASANWLAKLAAKADEVVTDGAVKSAIIGMWLDEACEAESA